MTTPTPNPQNVESEELEKILVKMIKNLSAAYGRGDGSYSMDDFKNDLLAWRDTHTQREVAKSFVNGHEFALEQLINNAEYSGRKTVHLSTIRAALAALTKQETK